MLRIRITQCPSKIPTKTGYLTCFQAPTPDTWICKEVLQNRFILLASCSPLPGSRPSPSPALLPCTSEQRNKSRWSPDVGDSGICGPFEQEDNTPCSGAASPPWRAPVTPAWVSRGGPTTKLTPHWDGLLRWVAYSIGVQELLCVLEWSAVMVLLPSGKGCTRIL